LWITGFFFLIPTAQVIIATLLGCLCPVAFVEKGFTVQEGQVHENHLMEFAPLGSFALKGVISHNLVLRELIQMKKVSSFALKFQT
jgi:hypothetical protein